MFIEGKTFILTWWISAICLVTYIHKVDMGNMSLSEKETRIIDIAQSEFPERTKNTELRNAFRFSPNDSLTSNPDTSCTGLFVLLSPPRIKEKWVKSQFGTYEPFPQSSLVSDYKGMTNGSFQAENHQVLTHVLWDNTTPTNSLEYQVMGLKYTPPDESSRNLYTIYYYFYLPDLGEYGCYAQSDIDASALQKNGKKHYEDQMTSYVTNLVSKLDNGGFR